MPLDLLDITTLLAAVAQITCSGGNAITIRRRLAEACDVAIDFLQQGCRAETFKLNEAQRVRLLEACSDFVTNEDDRKLLETAESAAVKRVQEILRGAARSISDDQLSAEDGLALIAVLERTRYLLRRA